MDVDLTLPLHMALCQEPQGTQSLSSSIRKRRVRGFKKTNHNTVRTLTVCESEETGALDLDLGFGMGRRGGRGRGRAERREGGRGSDCRTSLKLHNYSTHLSTRHKLKQTISYVVWLPHRQLLAPAAFSLLAGLIPSPVPLAIQEPLPLSLTLIS